MVGEGERGGWCVKERIGDMIECETMRERVGGGEERVRERV